MSDASESVLVNCPRCAGQFRAGVRVTAYFAPCPDCAEPVRVPALAEVADELERERAAAADEEETYRLALPPIEEDSIGEPEEPSPPEAARPLSPPHPSQDDSRQRSSGSATGEEADPAPSPSPGSPQVKCPACGASFEVAFTDKPHTVLCPECLEDVPIPARSELPPSPPPSQPTKPPEPKPAEADALGEEPAESAKSSPKKTKQKRRPASETEPVSWAPPANPSRGERPRKDVHDVMAEIRQVEVDPPPERLFFSGVTDFLFRPEVLTRWGFASLGFCLVGWLIAVCAHFYDAFPFALAFFALPLIWLGMMTLSYTAACSMPILLETSSGNDRIEGWPEPVMKEQAVDLVYLMFLFIVAEVMSFFAGQVLSVVLGPAWLVALVLAFLLYPVILLSSLEANTPFMPFTWPILKSLKTLAWAWGAFYGLSGGLLLVWVVPFVWGFRQGGWTLFFTMIFVAPLIAGWCFLYARLLGRLAWRVSLEFETEDDEQDPSDKPEHKKRQKKNPGSKLKPNTSGSSGELQAAR